VNISREVKVGAIALVALVILYFGVKFLKGFEVLSKSRQYYAVYDNIDGLKVSNAVIINGYPVGKVTSIRMVPEIGYKLVVQFQITVDLALGKNTKAILATPGLLSDKAIELKVEQGGGMLQNGDTLQSMVQAGMVSELKEQALPLLETVDSTGAAVQVLLKEYHGMGQSVKATMENARQITAQMNAKLAAVDEREIRATLQNMRTISDTLNRVSKELPVIASNIRMLSDSLKQVPIATLSKDIQQTVNSLNEVMVLLKSKEGTAGMLMNDKALYLKMDQTLSSLDSLLVDLRENPKKYINVSVF